MLIMVIFTVLFNNNDMNYYGNSDIYCYNHDSI
jgi:hypothetical protein